MQIDTRFDTDGKKEVMKTLATILLPIVILLVLESCARTIVTLRQDVATRAPVEPVLSGTVASRELGWERLPNYESPPGNRIFDAQGFQAHDTAQVADKETPRIVAIGDSTTYGYGVSSESSFVELLDRALPSASVINLGMLGYSSFQGYQSLLKYGDQLQPAAILASFNYNDRRYVFNRDIDSEQKFARYVQGQEKASAYAWINNIYTARLLRSVMRRIGLIQSNPVVDVDTDVRSLEARVPPERYRDNLRKIAEYGRAKNIPVIFLLLKDNSLYTTQLRAGIEYRQSGQPERALRALMIGLSNSVSGPLARKYLVQIYEDMGADDKAAAIARIDAHRDDMDGGQVIYLDAEYNKIMVEVAREFGIKVVDARPMLDANPEVFLDMCHPDAVGHAHIADLLLQAVKEVAPGLAKGAVGTTSDSTGGHRPRKPE